AHVQFRPAAGIRGGNPAESAFRMHGQALVGADPELAVGTGQQGPDPDRRQCRGVLRQVCVEAHPVEAGQAALGPDPEVALAVLGQAQRGDLGQAVLDGPGVADVVDVALRGVQRTGFGDKGQRRRQQQRADTTQTVPDRHARVPLSPGPSMVSLIPAPRGNQHSMTLTARPPREVSLYLSRMSRPVSRMVRMTLSRLTLCLPSPRRAMRDALIAFTEPMALRSMQGICTSPPIGSQVRPRLCSMPISAAFSTCDMLPPSAAVSPAAAIEQATPTSPWQPTSAPLIEAFSLYRMPTAAAVSRKSNTPCSTCSADLPAPQ